MNRDTYKDICITNDILPVSAEIFYEDGTPYIKYVGKTISDDGTEYKVEIDKLSLVINGLEGYSETLFNGRVSIPIKRQFFANTNDVAFKLILIKRKCTIADLEKELGYKIELKE